jgi:hypothetical protein
VLDAEFGRFRAVSVVAGVIPLGLIGELISSTLFSRIVTQVMYLLVVRGKPSVAPA